MCFLLPPCLGQDVRLPVSDYRSDLQRIRTWCLAYEVTLDHSDDPNRDIAIGATNWSCWVRLSRDWEITNVDVLESSNIKWVDDAAQSLIRRVTPKSVPASAPPPTAGIIVECRNKELHVKVAYPGYRANTAALKTPLSTAIMNGTVRIPPHYPDQDKYKQIRFPPDIVPWLQKYSTEIDPLHRPANSKKAGGTPAPPG